MREPAQRMRPAGIVNIELLFFLAVAGIIAALILPLANRFHWGALTTLSVLIACFALFCLCLAGPSVIHEAKRIQLIVMLIAISCIVVTVALLLVLN